VRYTASMTKRITRVPSVQEVFSSNPVPAKSYTALQTVLYRYNIYASNCVALAM